MEKRVFKVMIIHGQAGGYWVPKYELVPKVTVDQKKTSTDEKVEIRICIRIFFGPYELEIRNRSQIRIRIYVLDVFAVKIRIGPLIFPPIRRIRGGGTVPPCPSMAELHFVTQTSSLSNDM